VNDADTNELYCVQFSGSWILSLTLTLIVQLHTKLLVTIRDILQTTTGAQGSSSCSRSHTLLAS